MPTTSTYRVTMTDTTGAESLLAGLTQDDVDELIDQHESRDSAYPVGVVERQKKDGTWAPAGGWDVRPRELTTPPATSRDYAAGRSAEMAAVAAINDANDRRENRRAYYLRTGR